jgi:outer membrane lipoprotein carrier protein
VLTCLFVSNTLTLALLLLGGAPDGSVAGAEALARKIQAHHSAVRDLRGHFVQTYTSGLLGRTVIERGALAIKRPDRMLWRYEKPEEKLFVSDGHTSYFYVPADRQVIVKDIAGEQGVAFSLLSGRKDLLGEFQIYAVPGSADQVRLIPKAADPETREIVMTAAPSGRITALEITDVQGNHSAFRFEDIEENAGLPDALFTFKIPRGVEVVTG